MYFADPHSPWQRGTNENTNGRLRQYFPEGTNLSTWSAEELAAVAHALSTRPRKTMGCRTPAEAFDEHLQSLTQTVLRRPVESAQYLSLACTDRPIELGITPSVGPVGNS
ncbi:hypothetical protein GOOTI_254_00135 [Gordonia otitidis NBRC 100426]|uniref:Transposase n=1 Tax=Gordonia otitidis (strain DSM 44809 / CCUG 52243 / JCM 12355 / NBRC 100426 / IFM 10032) TaxID=1108044 RepID=H5TU62_GORO1|nr:hypothetical protein GOOTI_254_00135 [Gordonia otitidis NBRC 100426]